MLAFQIREVKAFMAKLFQKNDFDRFPVKEGSVQTSAGYQINGHRNKAFYAEEEYEALVEKEFLTWEEMKPVVFQMIRGAKSPQLLQLVLQLTRSEIRELLQISGAGIQEEQITGAYMNLRYQSGSLQLVTGVGYETFVPDKAFERKFDWYVREILKEKEIPFDEI